MSQKKLYIIANFGGPREEKEIAPFLKELLSDPEVIRTPFPLFIQKPFFQWVAKKRAKTVLKEYQKMGGKSPIFEDTEQIGSMVKELLQEDLLCFHRYLPSTHTFFFQRVKEIAPSETIVFPMFAQFSYTTTGSIAKFFYEKMPYKERLKWVFSYASQEPFVQCFVEKIQKALQDAQFTQENTFFLFSCHGLPYEYVKKGDPYQKECEISFQKILSYFPKALGKIAYQSQFGKKEWLRPYTQDVCKNISIYREKRPHVLLIPLSFTSDHLETLVEIEELYLPLIKEQGLKAYRCPALNTEKTWICAIKHLMQNSPLFETKKLLRLPTEKATFLQKTLSLLRKFKSATI